MPTLGRTYKAISNRVTNLPSLPTEIVRGSVSIEASFEQHPTGSIVIEAIPESEIHIFRKAYNSIGKEIQIYDYWFRIANYSEMRENLEGSDLLAPIVVFNIAVNLEGYNLSAVNNPIYVRRSSPDNINRVTTASTISLANLAKKGNIQYKGYNQEIKIPSDQGINYSLNFSNQLSEKIRVEGKFVDYTSRTVRTVDFDKGSTYTFTANEILEGIETSVQKPIQFNNTQLSSNNGFLAESEADIRAIKLKNFLGDDPLVKKPPTRRDLEEGDENPEQPPADIRNLTSLDLNFDASGPRKTYRKTEYLNNKVMKETVRQYGLAYLANQIKNPLAENPLGS